MTVSTLNRIKIRGSSMYRVKHDIHQRIKQRVKSVSFLLPLLLIGAPLAAPVAAYAADTAEITNKTDAAKAEVAAAEEAVEQVADTETAQPATEEMATAEAPTQEAVSTDEPVAHDEASVMPSSYQPNVIDEPEDEALRNVFLGFRERFPTLSIDALADGPYEGLYEVITDSRVVYVTEDLSLLFQGNIIDLNHGIDITEARLAGIHMGLINSLGESKMLVYKAEPASDRNITVFTDINCGYCRLLHSEIDTLLTGGVNVRYLMFPRAGLESESRVALESVWCADNPQQAMTSAKAGEPIQEESCDTPVQEHYDLAGKVGLRGTPLIYLDNGTAIPGYREAAAIIEMIHSTEPMSN